MLQPLLPMDPDALVDRIAPYVRSVRIDRMYELDRVRHVYQELGREDASTDAFFTATTDRLLERFRARGIPTDAFDDLSALVAK